MSCFIAQGFQNVYFIADESQISEHLHNMPQHKWPLLNPCFSICPPNSPMTFELPGQASKGINYLKLREIGQYMFNPLYFETETASRFCFEGLSASLENFYTFPLAYSLSYLHCFCFLLVMCNFFTEKPPSKLTDFIASPFSQSIALAP